MSMTCFTVFLVPYSFELLGNINLMSIDLSSLEEITGDALRFVSNPSLCYTGNITSYLTKPSEQFQCIGAERKNSTVCSKLKLLPIIIINRHRLLDLWATFCTQ